VPQQFSGRGISSQRVRGVFGAIRASGRTAVLRYCARHRGYSDIVDG